MDMEEKHSFLEKYETSESYEEACKELEKRERITPRDEIIESTEETNTEDQIERIYEEETEATTSIYSLKGKKQVEKIIQLHKHLNEFRYGYVDSSGKERTDNEFVRYYRLQSPEEFEKSKIGVCWDYTIYQTYKLHRYGIEHLNIYIELETPMSDTHTFTVCKVDDYYIYLETSYEKIRGIYRADSLDKIILFVLNTMLSDHRGVITSHIHKFKDYKRYGGDCLTFMNDMRRMDKIKTIKTKYSKTYTPKVDMIYGSNHLAFTESADELFLEEAIANTKNFKNLLWNKIDTVLSVPENDRKIKRFVSEFIDANITKLTTSGPVYLIVFGDKDQEKYFNLIGVTPEEIKRCVKDVVKATGSNSDFKLLTGNPIYVLLYYCIRFYSLKGDKKGLNALLSIYAIAVYWSIYTKFFPNGVIEPIMQFTIDNLTDKFLIKKSKHIFGALTESIQRSYEFHKNKISVGNDNDCIAFIQRIRNDQNSMIKKIANEYMKNYKEGNAITTRNDDYDPNSPILDTIENATSAIQAHMDKVCLPIISNGVDVVYAEAAAKMAGISVADTRLYLLKLMVPNNLPVLEQLIESILFLFIYEDKRRISDIKSRYFLAWAASIFKKTNSKNKNIGRINAILEKWAEESGIYERFTREASRINYKKAIFFYIILSIQKYS